MEPFAQTWEDMASSHTQTATAGLFLITRIICLLAFFATTTTNSPMKEDAAAEWRSFHCDITAVSVAAAAAAAVFHCLSTTVKVANWLVKLRKWGRKWAEGESDDDPTLPSPYGAYSAAHTLIITCTPSLELLLLLLIPLNCLKFRCNKRNGMNCSGREGERRKLKRTVDLNMPNSRDAAPKWRAGELRR